MRYTKHWQSRVESKILYNYSLPLTYLKLLFLFLMKAKCGINQHCFTDIVKAICAALVIRNIELVPYLAWLSNWLFFPMAVKVRNVLLMVNNGKGALRSSIFICWTCKYVLLFIWNYLQQILWCTSSLTYHYVLWLYLHCLMCFSKSMILSIIFCSLCF